MSFNPQQDVSPQGPPESSSKGKPKPGELGLTEYHARQRPHSTSHDSLDKRTSDTIDYSKLLHRRPEREDIAPGSFANPMDTWPWDPSQYWGKNPNWAFRGV